MTREKNFLEQLNANEVAYMMQKRNEVELRDQKEEFE